MDFKVNDTIEITIEKLTFNGGRGLSRVDGVVVFVPFVIPGEKVRVRITKVKKSFAEAELLEVLEASPDRISAPCPKFSLCGGCTWQHIPYQEQVKHKTQILTEIVSRLDPTLELDNFFSAPNEYNYRNRIQVQTKHKKTFFKKRKSNDLIDFKNCLLAEKPINEYLESHRESWSQKNLQRIEVALDTEGNVVEMSRQFKNKVRLFSQVNTLQNQKLIEEVLNLVESITPSKIYDLYCGAGNFTFPLQKKFKEVSIVGVDLSETNIAMAQETLTQPSPEFICESVEDYLLNHPLQGGSFVLVDPPRTGLEPKACEALFNSDADSIIYISCNPMTFTRDVTVALSKGYKLSYVAGLDMFPQTDHIEVISLLSKH